MVIILTICLLAGLILPRLSTTKIKKHAVNSQESVAQISKQVIAYTLTWNNSCMSVNRCNFPGRDEFLNMLTDGAEAEKKVFSYPVEYPGLGLSYSLNCRELYQKSYKTSFYQSWKNPDFARSSIRLTPIISADEQVNSKTTLDAASKPIPADYYGL